MILKRRTDFKIMKALSQHIWPKNDIKTKKDILLAFGFLTGSKLLNVQVPRIFKGIINNLNVDTANMSVSMANPNHIILSTIGYMAVKVGSNVMNEYKNFLLGNVSLKATRDISTKLYKNLLRQDYDFFNKSRIGTLTKKLDRGSKSIDFIMSSALFHLIPTFIESGLVCSIIWYNYGTIYGLVTVGTMITYSLYTVLITRWRTNIRKSMIDYENNTFALATDVLINHDTVKIFNSHIPETIAYNKQLGLYQKDALKTLSSLNILNSGQMLIYHTGASILLLMGAMDVIAGTQTIGDLVMVNALLGQLQGPLNILGSMYRRLRRALVDSKDFFDLLERLPKNCYNDKNMIKILDRSPVSVEYSNISFSYNNNHDYKLLEKFNFKVAPGEKVALIGQSGSGKSTIARLLLLQHGNYSGKILINNIDLKKYDFNSIMDNIKLVPQDVKLFHRSIYDNIAYAKPSATKNEIINAAKKAMIHESIIKTSKGYETIVGERGTKLSGGEKQRIRLAQIFLNPPPMVIFDESTSALDPLTEEQICREIIKLNSTIIFITHRYNTLKHFKRAIKIPTKDKIIV